MILVPRAEGEGLAGAVLGDEFLEAVGGPDVEEAEEGHHGEPVGGCVEVAGAVVTMEGEHRTDYHAPFDRFVGHLELEKRF